MPGRDWESGREEREREWERGEREREREERLEIEREPKLDKGSV